MATPHKIGEVSDASYSSTMIELFAQALDESFTKVGHGTGFFYRLGGRTALATNWHVLTGRHPEQPSRLLDGYPQSPTHFQLHMTTLDAPTYFEPGPMLPLYREDAQPMWYEGSQGGEEVDLAFVFVDFDPRFKAMCVNEHAPYNDTLFTPGMDVVIVGYPFARDASNPFPIWKKAMISSEPRFLTNERLYAYLDTPGRPGMSGSPVYFLRRGFQATADEVSALNQASGILEKLTVIEAIGSRFFMPVPTLEFAGIYSGSYGDGHLDRLSLGRFWPVGLVGDIERDLRPGKNPFPPFDV